VHACPPWLRCVGQNTIPNELSDRCLTLLKPKQRFWFKGLCDHEHTTENRRLEKDGRGRALEDARSRNDAGDGSWKIGFPPELNLAKRAGKTFDTSLTRSPPSGLTASAASRPFGRLRAGSLVAGRGCIGQIGVGVAAILVDLSNRRNGGQGRPKEPQAPMRNAPREAARRSSWEPGSSQPRAFANRP